MGKTTTQDADVYIPIQSRTIERLIVILRDYAEHTEAEYGYSFSVGVAKQIVEELHVALNGGNWWTGDRL